MAPRQKYRTYYYSCYVGPVYTATQKFANASSWTRAWGLAQLTIQLGCRVLQDFTCPNPNWTPEVTSSVLSYEYSLTFAGFTEPAILITG
jgi:hypothetical protein